jgi:uroporphyrinogen-III synthase
VSSNELVRTAIVVLRVSDGPDMVAEELVRRGASVRTVRVAAVVDRPDDVVRDAIGVLERFAWVAVTSANAARRLGPFADRWPRDTRVGVVGPATLAAVESIGLRANAVATQGTAADLARSVEAGPVLFLAASNARADLPTALERRGIEVLTVVAYDVGPIALDVESVAMVRSSDALVAMAPSAIDALDSLEEPARSSARRVPLVAFGPSTARRAVELEWPVTNVAATREPRAVADAVAVTLDATPGR